MHVTECVHYQIFPSLEGNNVGGSFGRDKNLYIYGCIYMGVCIYLVQI